MPIGVSPFEAFQVFALAVAVPLSLLAVRGFGESPFGRVLRPLPVASVTFLLAVSVSLAPLSESMTAWSIAALMAVGTLAMGWMALQLSLLVGQRRRL